MTEPRGPDDGAVSLAWASFGEAGGPLVEIRCLDAGDAQLAARELSDGLLGAPCASGRGSMRWHGSTPGALLPALSVHERGRLHLSLGAGARIVRAPGRLQRLDAEGRSHLWTLDGHVGLGALELARGERVHRLALRVRARWCEPTEMVTAVMREVCLARWSAAVRDDARDLTLRADVDVGHRHGADHERLVLAVLAASEEVPRSLRALSRSPGVELRTAVAPVAPMDPRATELLAARGIDPADGWRGGRSLRLPRPTSSLDTADNRLLRALLDALAARSAALAAEGAALRGVFARWRAEVPWIESVPPRRGPFGAPRREVYRPFARAMALLETARPSLGFSGGVDVSPWDSPRIYERWCALELSRALGLSDDGGAAVMEGEAASVELYGMSLRLEAQRRFESALPLAFRPDLTVSRGARRVHLDAKYRLDPSQGDGAVVRDELVKMHAYRDAIAGSVGAYALFPGVASESIDGRDDRGGVGAVALRADLDAVGREAQRGGLRSLLRSLLG